MVFLLILSLAFSPVTAASRSQSAPRTVIDYYRLLPGKYFEADLEKRVTWMLDSKRGAIVDEKNGYIYAPGDGAQTDIYLCLFRKPDNTYLIGVKTHAADTNQYTYLDFYIYKDRGLKDVTKQVLPIPINDELRYEMPRYGTTIRVTRANGKKLYDLIWINGAFELKKR